jgi:hypothetical protein
MYTLDAATENVEYGCRFKAIYIYVTDSVLVLSLLYLYVYSVPAGPVVYSIFGDLIHFAVAAMSPAASIHHTSIHAQHGNTR